MPSQRAAPLLRGWSKHVKSSLLHATSLAAMALTVARSRYARSRLQAELERANGEIALLKEELAIKDARWGRLPSRRRPHFTPIQRMRILGVKAVCGWSCEEASRAVMIDEQTMWSWLRRVDEEGEDALIQISEPVNKFPDLVRYLVKQLKVLLPTMGKARIAEILARAGLHLGVTTVGRMLNETDPIPEDVVSSLTVIDTRVVTAGYPGEVWHVDLTTVPTGPSFWVPWFPFALPQSWRFCWWIAVVVDHFSRAVVGFAIFPRRSNGWRRSEISKSSDPYRQVLAQVHHHRQGSAVLVRFLQAMVSPQSHPCSIRCRGQARKYRNRRVLHTLYEKRV